MKLAQTIVNQHGAIPTRMEVGPTKQETARELSPRAVEPRDESQQVTMEKSFEGLCHHRHARIPIWYHVSKKAYLARETTPEEPSTFDSMVHAGRPASQPVTQTRGKDERVIFT